MENFCRTCKIEIPLMGLTGRKRAFCGDKCKLFYTNHIKHFDIALATSDASYCTTEDDCRSWASIWCLDSKKAFRRKVLEHKFSIGINLEDFISKINSYIDNHPTNEFLTKRSQQFNAWYSNTTRKICPVCTKKYPSFNQTKWRVYCSEKCCNIAKRSGGAIRDTMDRVVLERYGVLGCNTPEIVEKRERDYFEKTGYKNPMHVPGNLEKSMETRKANGFSKISKAEIEIKEFIESLGLVVESNVWNVIERKELDLYVHSKKIAIEYNGCFFHSEGNGGEEYAKLRHVEKTNLCEEKNIQLIHIWEDEWVNNKGTVKAYLESILIENNCEHFKHDYELHIVDDKVLVYTNTDLIDIEYLLEKYKDKNLSFIAKRCRVSFLGNRFLDSGLELNNIIEPNVLYTSGCKDRIKGCEITKSKKYHKIFDSGSLVYSYPINKK